MDQKKVCMIGSFAVGKTSLVRQYVHGMFSDRYKSTIGVKIDRRTVEMKGREAALILWDLAGEDELMSIRSAYVRGANGLFIVIDGTRSDTLTMAVTLCDRLEEEFGPLPRIFVLNKLDIRDQWSLDRQGAADAIGERGPLIETSAKTGEGIEQAFQDLADRMAEPGS